MDDDDDDKISKATSHARRRASCDATATSKPCNLELVFLEILVNANEVELVGNPRSVLRVVNGASTT